MSRVLPGPTPWPGPQPVGRLEPGCSVYQQDLEALVLALHALFAYWGCEHFSQIFYGGCVISSGPTQVLTGIVRPRHQMTALTLQVLLDSDAGCEISATCEGVTDTLSKASGVQSGSLQLDAVDSPDVAVLLTVTLDLAVGSTWASLLAISCCDSDLTAV